MRKLSIIMIILLLIGVSVEAEENVKTVVSKANNIAYYGGVDGKAEIDMVITDKQGRQRTRSFSILRMDIEDGGEQKYYVYFTEPGDVREMVYMVWKHLNSDDDRWLYLPALDLVRRVASGDKRSSFVGSDFLYEDVSGRSIDLDEHSIIEETEGHYKIKSVPKSSQDADFAYYTVLIEKSGYMPVKAEYYDDNNKIFRTVEALEVETIDGHPTVTKSKATNKNTGSSTILEFRNIKYDLGLTGDIFTERSLRRPPLNWLE
jgi:hypothetical protein